MVPGCEWGELNELEERGPYMTPDDLATRAAVDEDMKNHVYAAHTLPMEMEKIAVSKMEMEAKKIEAEAAKILAEKAPQSDQGEHVSGPSQQRGEKKASIPRPDIEEGITESDWSFFLASWNRYVTACKLEPGEEISHLWSACSESVQKQLHNKGARNECDKGKLVKLIKQLAVRK